MMRAIGALSRFSSIRPVAQRTLVSVVHVCPRRALPVQHFPRRFFSSDSELPTGTPSFSDVPGVKADGDKMVIMFTCTVCDTRSARKISKRAYTEGIVLVRCGGCKNRHLIADRMGVFEDSIADQDEGLQPGTGWDIQKYLAKEMGTTSKYITDENVFELTVQDILGAKAAALHEGTEPLVPKHDPNDARI